MNTINNLNYNNNSSETEEIKAGNLTFVLEVSPYGFINLYHLKGLIGTFDSKEDALKRIKDYCYERQYVNSQRRPKKN